MNTLTQSIRQAVAQALKDLFGKDVAPESLTLNETNKEFAGDYTVVLFALAKLGLGKPEEFGAKIGDHLVQQQGIISAYNVVKGFLNLSVADDYWKNFLLSTQGEKWVKSQAGTGRRVMVEFSSPNTNKPLHLGHLRNNFLGYSVCRILEACDYDVVRVCLVNDRGIAICKSMLMYQMYGNGETPASTGQKPDFFVVKYYVRFGDEQEKQMNELIKQGMTEKEAENKTQVMQDAREMLLRWENGDPDIIALWEKLNNWVYEGFEQTYRRIGVKFDQMYYESKTWLLGKNIVEEGLAKGVFFKKDDGSVWVDNTAEGLDQKVLQRADGTSLYMTQDLGTADQRHKELNMDAGIYVVADEQDYHFKTLFLTLKKLGRAWADNLHHLSYGMVDLPEGRMKTRTGNTVDADDLIDEVVAAAAAETAERGKTEGMNENELKELHEKIGLAALRFFLLKVHPKKRMVFNPKESVDINGFTGPFVQYAYARTRALERKAAAQGITWDKNAAAGYVTLREEERALLRALYRYPEVLGEACKNYDPSAMANYAYEVARTWNHFYHEVIILQADDAAATAFRMSLAELAGTVLKAAMGLLGIEMPERM